MSRKSILIIAESLNSENWKTPLLYRLPNPPAFSEQAARPVSSWVLNIPKDRLHSPFGQPFQCLTNLIGEKKKSSVFFAVWLHTPVVL